MKSTLPRYHRPKRFNLDVESFSSPKDGVEIVVKGGTATDRITITGSDFCSVSLESS